MIQNFKKIYLILFLTMLFAGITTYAIAARDVEITADKQSFSGESNITMFEGNVVVKSDDITVKSPKAKATLDKNGKLKHALFLKGATAIQDRGLSKSEIKSNIIRLSLLNNIITAEGDSFSKVKKGKQVMVTIKADSQEFDLDTDLMKALGSVEIDYKDMKTYSNQADIYVNQDGGLKKVKLFGDARIITEENDVEAQTFIFNPQINELIAVGKTHSRTKMEDDSKVDIWANYQQYDKKNNTLMTSGNVKIYYKDYSAFGPKAIFLPDAQTGKPNRVIFTGRSKIHQGSRIVEADKIEMTIDPKNFNAIGNVRSKFTQKEDVMKKNKKGS